MSNRWRPARIITARPAPRLSRLCHDDSPAPLDAAALYAALAQVQPSLADVHPAIAPISVPASTVLFHKNAPCQGFALVLIGLTRTGTTGLWGLDGRSAAGHRIGRRVRRIFVV